MPKSLAFLVSFFLPMKFLALIPPHYGNKCNTEEANAIPLELWHEEEELRHAGNLGRNWFTKEVATFVFIVVEALVWKKKDKRAGSFWINADLMKRVHWFHGQGKIPTVLNKQFSASNSSAFVSPLWNSDYRHVSKPTGFTTKTQRSSFYHKDQDNNCVPTRKEQLKPCNKH